MLVTFKCEAHGDITMFGNVAEHLLKLMGHSGTIPSAIYAKDVPVVLKRLENAIGSTTAEPIEDASTNNEDEDKESQVSLKNRAFPLIEMLTAAAEAECSVMWDKN